jgi:hypothetical protein
VCLYYADGMYEAYRVIAVTCLIKFYTRKAYRGVEFYLHAFWMEVSVQLYTGD